MRLLGRICLVGIMSTFLVRETPPNLPNRSSDRCVHHLNCLVQFISVMIPRLHRKVARGHAR